jgi:hypothetical protein
MNPLTTRQTDQKARISLPKSFANSTVIIEQVSDTEIRIRKAVVVPEDEIPFFEESLQPLSNADRDLFLSMIDRPSKPTRTFRKAAKRYQELCQNGQLSN